MPNVLRRLSHSLSTPDIAHMLSATSNSTHSYTFTDGLPHEVPSLEGVLRKKSSTTVMSKHSWVSRYFALWPNSGKLAWFMSEREYHSKHNKQHTSAHCIRISDITELYLCPKKSTRRFEIDIGEQRIEIEAKTAALAQEWVEAIQHAQERRQIASTLRMRSGVQCKFWHQAMSNAETDIGNVLSFSPFGLFLRKTEMDELAEHFQFKRYQPGSVVYLSFLQGKEAILKKREELHDLRHARKAKMNKNKLNKKKKKKRKKDKKTLSRHRSHDRHSSNNSNNNNNNNNNNSSSGHHSGHSSGHSSRGHSPTRGKSSHDEYINGNHNSSGSMAHSHSSKQLACKTVLGKKACKIVSKMMKRVSSAGDLLLDTSAFHKNASSTDVYGELVRGNSSHNLHDLANLPALAEDSEGEDSETAAMEHPDFSSFTMILSGKVVIKVEGKVLCTKQAGDCIPMMSTVMMAPSADENMNIGHHHSGRQQHHHHRHKHHHHHNRHHRHHGHGRSRYGDHSSSDDEEVAHGSSYQIMALEDTACIQITSASLQAFLNHCDLDVVARQRVRTVVGLTAGAYLKKIDMFKGIPQEKLYLAQSVLKCASLPGGSLLFNEGSIGDSLCIVLDGTVSAVKARTTNSDLQRELREQKTKEADEASSDSADGTTTPTGAPSPASSSRHGSSLPPSSKTQRKTRRSIGHRRGSASLDARIDSTAIDQDVLSDLVNSFSPPGRKHRTTGDHRKNSLSFCTQVDDYDEDMKQARAKFFVSQGSHETLCTFTKYDYFGEISLLMNIPRTAGIMANSDALLYELRKEDFDSLVSFNKNNVYLQESMRTCMAQHFRKYHDIPLFKRIPEDRYPLLARLCHIEERKPGERIIQQGEIGKDFYIIVDGEVSVTVLKRDADRRTRHETEVGRLGPGKYFGEIALVLDTPRTASITALTKLTLFSVTRENFEAFFQEAPEAVSDFELKLAKYDVKLRSIINHPTGYKYFCKFIKSNYDRCTEMEFWQACRDLRSATWKDALRERINAEQQTRAEENKMKCLWNGAHHLHELSFDLCLFQNPIYASKKPANLLRSRTEPDSADIAEMESKLAKAAADEADGKINLPDSVEDGEVYLPRHRQGIIPPILLRRAKMHLETDKQILLAKGVTEAEVQLLLEQYPDCLRERVELYFVWARRTHAMHEQRQLQFKWEAELPAHEIMHNLRCAFKLFDKRKRGCISYVNIESSLQDCFDLRLTEEMTSVLKRKLFGNQEGGTVNEETFIRYFRSSTNQAIREINTSMQTAELHKLERMFRRLATYNERDHHHWLAVSDFYIIVTQQLGVHIAMSELKQRFRNDKLEDAWCRHEGLNQHEFVTFILMERTHQKMYNELVEKMSWKIVDEFIRVEPAKQVTIAPEVRATLLKRLLVDNDFHADTFEEAREDVMLILEEKHAAAFKKTKAFKKFMNSSIESYDLDTFDDEDLVDVSEKMTVPLSKNPRIMSPALQAMSRSLAGVKLPPLEDNKNNNNNNNNNNPASVSAKGGFTPIASTVSPIRQVRTLNMNLLPSVETELRKRDSFSIAATSSSNTPTFQADQKERGGQDGKTPPRISPTRIHTPTPVTASTIASIQQQQQQQQQSATVYSTLRVIVTPSPRHSVSFSPKGSPTRKPRSASMNGPTKQGLIVMDGLTLS